MGKGVCHAGERCRDVLRGHALCRRGHGGVAGTLCHFAGAKKGVEMTVLVQIGASPDFEECGGCEFWRVSTCSQLRDRV